MPTAFISYSRRNRHFAERLGIDLTRAGVTARLDLRDIPPGDDFSRVIRTQIGESDALVLLASPEAATSRWVEIEVKEAENAGKRIVPLCVAGSPGALPWGKTISMIEDAGADYWGAVRRLARELGAPRPELPSVLDLLNGDSATVVTAAGELVAGIETAPQGRRFCKLPVAPSGFCKTWLFAPDGARLRWPESLGVLFNFTNERPGTRHWDSLAHWAGQIGADAESWLLMVEGPVDHSKKHYELKADKPHEWEDCRQVCNRAVEEFAKRCGRVGYYLNCLVPLAFEVGLRATMTSNRRRIYHYNARPESGPARYETAFDGWPAS